MQQSFLPEEIQGIYQYLLKSGVSLKVEAGCLVPCFPKTISSIEYKTLQDLIKKNVPGLIALLQGKKVHSFNESNVKGNDPRYRPFYEMVYRDAFYNIDGVHWSANGNTPIQKQGCDAMPILTSGENIKIDNKTRFKVYDDIALEHISNDRYDTPGWMEKDLSIDFLCYAFIPSRQAYLLPWQPLKKAWLKNKDAWLELANKEIKEERQGFWIVTAPNPGYNTLSCAVPIELLLNEVQGALFISVDWDGPND